MNSKLETNMYIMTSDKTFCPFGHWDTIYEYIPECYFLLGLSFDNSWFLTAPKYSTFRVNTRKHSIEYVINIFNQQFREEAESKCADPPKVYAHPSLPDCIVIEPWETKIEEGPNDLLGDVIVDVPCANSVLRGADVYAPAILGLFASAKDGDKVNIFADLDKKCRRGYVKKFLGKKYYIGQGTLKMDRHTLFKNNANPKGVGVKVNDNLSRIPRIDLPREYGILQNLPSIVCGHLFSNITGNVLDMCAAPGNKTTHIACIIGEKGRVIAVDKTPSKVSRMQEQCNVLGLKNVECHVFNSTRCVLKEGEDVGVGAGPPFLPGTFQAVLLDPPCSALGQRPALFNPITLSQLKSFVVLQEKLFRAAVELLESGGMLVYSTCTITLEENEGMVAWALKEFPSLSLQELNPTLGKPGIKIDNLSEEQRLLVNRFGSLHQTTPDEDTIGFFIAKFVKNKFV